MTAAAPAAKGAELILRDWVITGSPFSVIGRLFSSAPLGGATYINGSTQYVYQQPVRAAAAHR